MTTEVFVVAFLMIVAGAVALCGYNERCMGRCRRLFGRRKCERFVKGKKTALSYEHRHMGARLDADVVETSDSFGRRRQESHQGRSDVVRLCEIEKTWIHWAVRCRCRHRCCGCADLEGCPHSWDEYALPELESERIVRIVD